MHNQKHTIVLADDHPLLLRGLTEIIEEEENFEIVGQASDGEQALLLIEKERPDLAVLDIDITNNPFKDEGEHEYWMEGEHDID